MVPESNYTVAGAVKVTGPKFVGAFANVVLGAVEFDHEFGLRTNEVDDGASDYLLSEESSSIEAFHSELVPECAFRVGGIVAHISGKSFQLVFFVMHGRDDSVSCSIRRVGLAKVARVGGVSSPSRSEGDACEARRGCTKSVTAFPSTNSLPLDVRGGTVALPPP